MLLPYFKNITEHIISCFIESNIQFKKQKQQKSHRIWPNKQKTLHKENHSSFNPLTRLLIFDQLLFTKMVENT